jgi:4-amino-4-deoxy-L-arabinose transferase-like glycosyltransferase
MAGPTLGQQSSTSNHQTGIDSIPAAGRYKRYYPLALILALSAVVFFYGLGRLALAGPDEPRYAEVAREMLVSRDFISPRLGGCLWFEKPPLLYWLDAAAYQTFGVSEFAARLPSAMAALAAALFLYYSVATRLSKRLALIVGVVLVTSPLFVAYARAAVPDMLLACSLTLALLSVYLSLTSSGKARLWLWILGWVFAGFSVLAKGLVGILLFALITFLTLVLAGLVRRIRWRDVLYGGLVLLAVSSIWYVPVTVRHGDEFIREFFINHHFRRYLTNTYHHPQPIYFYPAILLAGVLPWTGFLVTSVTRMLPLRYRSLTRSGQATMIERDSDRSSNSMLLHYLAWVWLAVPLLFFSFSESKLPGYILPAIPALAIILGMGVDRTWEEAAGPGRYCGPSDRRRRVQARIAISLSVVLLAVLAAVFFAYLRGESLGRLSVEGLLGWAPLGLAVGGLAAFAVRKARVLIVCLALAAPVFVLAAVNLVLPNLNDKVSLKDLSLRLNERLRPGEKIAFYIYKEYAPVFYARGNVLCLKGAGDVLNAMDSGPISAALQSRPSLVVITKSWWVNDFKNDDGFVTEPLGSEGDTSALRVSLAAQSHSP